MSAEEEDFHFLLNGEKEEEKEEHPFSRTVYEGEEGSKRF